MPVKAIILTHSHRDHVSGASVFAEGENPEILASDKSSEDPLIVATEHPRATRAMQMRTKRQFGIGLSYPEEIIGIGVGPGDRPLKGMGEGILKPTISNAFINPHKVPVIKVIIIQIGIGIPKLKQRANIVAENATIPAIEMSIFPEIRSNITAKPKTPNSI